ncbi:hypothetical protein J7I80_06740 [Bacillus sp. ISL-41]|uniref:hypothetical protein n=1 Tax=Bacillus sp. ISL-41 TaxID=2819127 RepID=UPI001BE8A78E|nr:hypothetical protein [Bacillus sp. ISL-41]MBT2641914.1 hypothetical protein [Bacillus sp. ISL-41]
MRNNESLYFDIWRKRDFRNLLMAYTQTANQFRTQEDMRIGFGKMLDKYVDGGKKKYSGTKKQWMSAYTLGRELGVFRRKKGESYELSRLARDFLESRILASEYLLNYLLNFNQLIDGQIVHPLYEVLLVIKTNGGTVTRNNIINIPNFNLSSKTTENQRQIINIFIHRMIEAKIIEPTTQKEVFRLTSRYNLENLMQSCCKSDKSPEEFEEMTHEEYVDMLSVPNTIIQVYR